MGSDKLLKKIVFKLCIFTAQQNNSFPDLPGSIVGFVDSNSSQKLLFSSNNTTSTTVVTTTMTAGSPVNSAPSASCHYYPNKENPHQKLQQQQQQQQQQNYATKHARMGGNEYQGEIIMFIFFHKFNVRRF